MTRARSSFDTIDYQDGVRSRDATLGTQAHDGICKHRVPFGQFRQTDELSCPVKPRESFTILLSCRHRPRIASRHDPGGRGRAVCQSIISLNTVLRCCRPDHSSDHSVRATPELSPGAFSTALVHHGTYFGGVDCWESPDLACQGEMPRPSERVKQLGRGQESQQRWNLRALGSLPSGARPAGDRRRAWDSNPRDISAHQFSRLAPSAARTALLAPLAQDERSLADPIRATRKAGSQADRLFRAAARPSSSMRPVTSDATATTSCGAWPIANPRPSRDAH